MGPIPYTTYMLLKQKASERYKILVYHWNKESVTLDDKLMFDSLKNEIRKYKKKYSSKEWYNFSVAGYMDFLCDAIHIGD